MMPMATAPSGWVLPAGWTADNLGHCRSCQAPVLWCFTPAGRKAPANPDGTSHFATCPDAPAWRGGARPAVTRANVEPTPAAHVSRLSGPSGEGSR